MYRVNVLSDANPGLVNFLNHTTAVVNPWLEIDLASQLQLVKEERPQITLCNKN